MTRRSASELRWGFSSLGCPESTLEEACALAARFDIRDLELRALGGRLDLPDYLREMYSDGAGVAAVLQRFGQQVVSLDASFKLTRSDDTDRVELAAFADWAQALSVPYIRVFGGGSMEEPLTGAQLQRAADNLAWWQEEKGARGWDVDLVLETHDGFSNSPRCLALQEAAPAPVHLLWDSHHTWKLGGERLDETWSKIGPWVRHIHIKDSVSQPSARHPFTYVLPGSGEFPARHLLTLLEEAAYPGVVSLEWEVKWHPYLPTLEAALQALEAAHWRER